MRLIILFFFVGITSVYAQNGVLKGRVFNSLNNESIPFANIVLDSTMGTITDDEGNFRLEGLVPGEYNIICSYLGFETVVLREVRVLASKPTILEIGMNERNTTLNEITLESEVFVRSKESPVSLRKINATEIYRNPGGNRDISKVIQILPGVGSTASFRNDLIVRGGAPNENRFYIEGVEVPNINHFATQGSSGGPVGMLNVNFIKEVDFYSGAFPVNRGNALSSVMDFQLISGNDEKLSGNFMLGSSDVGLTLDGPMGEKSSFIFSLRRSYLQFLFKALALPFLPTYNDAQFKQNIDLNAKNKLTLIGLAAIDDFELNQSVNDGLTDSTTILRNNYILGNLPVNTQWNYTLGAVWTHYSDESFQEVVISRNQLQNNSEKYQDNIAIPANKLLDYSSQEIENKLRVEHTSLKNGWKWNFGFGLENATYTNSTFNKKAVGNEVAIIDFSSTLKLMKYALFSQLSQRFVDNRLSLSMGMRTDFNDYSKGMTNPLRQFSPRFSASYALSDKLFVNANAGRYYQLPSYTVMGYRDSLNNLVNQQNELKYIQSNHLVAGLEYCPSNFSKITLEGFWKTYQNYPFSLRDSISLANLGGDFGVIGNEPVSSSSQGRSYGLEFFIQQKLSSSIYGLLSYTFVRSQFQDKNNSWVATTWDNVHILNLTAGKKFNNNWEVGVKFRLLGGAPYTPYNRSLSATKEIWDASQQGVFDWNRLNEERLPASHSLDVRIDKKWYFSQWELNVYVDVQNLYNFQIEGPAYLDVVRDESGNPITDPNNSGKYVLSEIANTAGTLLPSVGIMIGF